RLEDHIERGFGRATEVPEPAGSNDLAQFSLAGLRAERCAHLLRQRGWYAHHRRSGVVDAADRVQIVFEPVAGDRLDDHPRAVGLQGWPAMRRRARRVAHIVQAIEKGDEVKIFFRIVLRRPDLEPGVRGDAVLAGMSLRMLDRAWMEIVADELRLRKSLRH